MDADWEIEIGGDAPVIEAHWAGFIDLRAEPDRARALVESNQLSGLADALVLLNAKISSVWTSKCDVFEPDGIDPDELDASPEESMHSIACYIDLLARDNRRWQLLSDVERDCKLACHQLQQIPLRCCRVDLVIREAFAAERNDLGITAYLAACGRESVDAMTVLAQCLAAFAESIVHQSR